MPISLKNMRACASPASTATAANPRPLRHRLNAHLADRYKSLAANPAAPCISELPFAPRPRKTASFRKPFSDAAAPRRNSSADATEYLRRRRSSADIRDGPRGSSCRYLLGDTASFKEASLDRRDDNPLALILSEPVTETAEPAVKVKSGKRDDPVRAGPLSRRGSDRSRALVPSQTVVKADYHGSTYSSTDGRSRFTQRAVVKSSSPPAPSAHQVVVLRVSLHCKGCEGKLRKHLSKMEGVTSFSIDLEMKKVTVIGTVTPLYVLNSISKVKNAQFWPSPVGSSSSSASSSSSSASSKSE